MCTDVLMNDYVGRGKETFTYMYKECKHYISLSLCISISLLRPYTFFSRSHLVFIFSLIAFGRPFLKKQLAGLRGLWSCDGSRFVKLNAQSRASTYFGHVIPLRRTRKRSGMSSTD